MKNVAKAVAPAPRAWVAPLLLLLTAAGSGYAFFSVINRYASNVLYYDAWDYYQPLFDERSVWAMFPRQHGPVRQGLGGVLLGVVAKATDWNTRADSFAVGIAIALALVAAFVAKKRMGIPLTPADALLPLLFLNLSQVESLVVVANPAHGAMPLLLGMLYVLAWTMPDRRWTYATVCVLNFFMIHTGFSIFIGLVTPALLLIDAYRNWREQHRIAWEPLAAFGVALLSLAIFFRGWVFEPSIDCFEFPHSRPLEYVWFVALMFARFLGVVQAGDFGVFLGTLLLIVLISVVVQHLIRLVRSPIRDTRSIAIVALGTWTLIFCANAAVGRVCAGLGGAQMSRYATLMIPGFFALYLHIVTMAEPLRARVLPVFATLVVTLPLMNWRADIDFGRRYAAGKQQWVDCYRAAHDVTTCDAAVRFSVYPTPTIREKLDYLEKNRLNLFAPR
jgi:hypothetical protein